MKLTIGILTISDRVSVGEMEDKGGPAIQDALQNSEWEVRRKVEVPDEQGQIAQTLRDWADQDHLDVIFTTGGTGLGVRDVTPEATLTVGTRQIPGIAEAMRQRGLVETPHAMLSRAVVALRGETLIINLPGSPKGAVEGIEVLRPVLEHAISTLRGGKH
jgi:molybdopterin adenylyltransferase